MERKRSLVWYCSQGSVITAGRPDIRQTTVPISKIRKIVDNKVVIERNSRASATYVVKKGTRLPTVGTTRKHKSKTEMVEERK